MINKMLLPLCVCVGGRVDESHSKLSKLLIFCPHQSLNICRGTTCSKAGVSQRRPHEVRGDMGDSTPANEWHQRKHNPTRSAGNRSHFDRIGYLSVSAKRGIPSCLARQSLTEWKSFRGFLKEIIDFLWPQKRKKKIHTELYKIHGT